MASIAPFSALNMYQDQPVGRVTRPGSIAAGSRSEFSAEQRMQGKVQQNLVMARANAKSAQLGLFSAAQNPSAAMQNVLQAQLLPAEASANMASFASPMAQQKLNLYRNLGAAPQTNSGSIYDLLRA